MLNVNNIKKKVELLPKRNEYYDAICEIADTTIINGKLIRFSNYFLVEATELVKKAVIVFEEGFFDCAFYLLRSASEVLLTLVYLAELLDEERESKLDDWKRIRKFPNRGKMLDNLSQVGKNFLEIKEALPKLFDEMQELNKKLNKYTHKQGFDKLYVYREMYMIDEKSKNGLTKEFEKAVESSIRWLAVMRLAIDPFPIFLLDEDIIRRTPNLPTNSYSDHFIEKYLSQEFVEKYKQLLVYKSWYDSFIVNNRQNDFIANIIHNQYIDSMHIEEILEQKELLSLSDMISVLMIKYNKKITSIYIKRGWIQYFSDRKGKSHVRGYDMQEFQKFEENNAYMNQKYGDAFITRFKFPDGIYLIEHTALLDVDEYNSLKQEVLNSLNSMEYFKEILDFCKVWYNN